MPSNRIRFRNTPAMHKPPTVGYPVRRSHFHALALLAIGCGAASVQAWWLWQVDAPDWRHWLGLLATLSTATAAFLGWWRTPVGLLRWDGQCWQWTEKWTSVSGSVTPHLDLQDVLLLRFTATGGATRWFWLERGTDRDNWRALRRAVLYGTPRDAGDGDPALETERRRRGRMSSL